MSQVPTILQACITKVTDGTFDLQFGRNSSMLKQICDYEPIKYYQLCNAVSFFFLQRQVALKHALTPQSTFINKVRTRLVLNPYIFQ